MLSMIITAKGLTAVYVAIAVSRSATGNDCLNNRQQTRHEQSKHETSNTQHWHKQQRYAGNESNDSSCSSSFDQAGCSQRDIFNTTADCRQASLLLAR